MTTTILSQHLFEIRGEVTFDTPLTAGMPLLDVVTLPDGRILVVRDGAGVNPDGSGIGGLVLDATGTLIADSGFAISQFTGGSQSHPDVAVLADGGIVVTWTAQNQDGFAGGVYGRVLNADLTPRGPEFQISDDAAADQGTAHVRARPDGGFVVGWNGDVPRVQYFTPDGITEGPSFALIQTNRQGQFEDLWVDAQGQVIALTRTTGGDGSTAPVALRNGLSQWVLTGPDGAQPVREWIEPNPSPTGNFNDMAIELFDIGNDLAVARHYSARGRFDPSNLMISVLDTGTPGFMGDILPGAQSISGDFAYGGLYVAAVDAGFARLGNGNLLAVYANAQSFPIDGWQIAVSEYRVNRAATGAVAFRGDPLVGQTLTADLSGLADADGLGALSLQWQLGGTAIAGATSASLELTDAMRGQQPTLMIRWTDGAGNPEAVLATVTGTITGAPIPLIGTEAPDNLLGTGFSDQLSGLGGADTLVAQGGDDTVNGGDGADRLNLGAGNDLGYGGDGAADLRDVVFAGEGNDTVFGGHGNDLLYGDLGDDILAGDFGADELIGQAGRDTLAGGQGADLLSGNDGNDFLNGGFGFDRLNGGAGTDSFLHMGLADHGSDWVQDYTAMQGDRLVFGNDAATADQFQVNFALAPGAGSAGIAEAFVIYRPTGQILWALVDGAAQRQIWLAIDGELNPLL